MDVRIVGRVIRPDVVLRDVLNFDVMCARVDGIWRREDFRLVSSKTWRWNRKLKKRKFLRKKKKLTRTAVIIVVVVVSTSRTAARLVIIFAVNCLKRFHQSWLKMMKFIQILTCVWPLNVVTVVRVLQVVDCRLQDVNLLGDVLILPRARGNVRRFGWWDVSGSSSQN